MFSTYVLYSDTYNRFYVGMTSNTSDRLVYHNSGYVKSTKAFIPWRIVHVENFETVIQARNREKYLKTAAGRRWRKANIKV